MLAALDVPAENSISDPLSVAVEGWVYAGERHGELVAIEVFGGTQPLARTELLFPRSDVTAALKLAPGTRTGFSLLVDAPAWSSRPQLDLHIEAVFRDGTRERPLSRMVALSGRDYRQGDWGLFLNREFPHLVRREHMYNSGPSVDTGSPELLSLLDRYLPVPPATLLDVGCGRGPYAEPLRARKYDWFGVEIKDEDCALLQQRGLPHTQVDGGRLPFDAGRFDAAICIEVLEHVPDPWSFITEIRRVISRRLIVSVPNAELVTYWRPHLAVPWHLLESDHRNFFSRVSLRELLRPHFSSVEVLTYGHAPLRTAEGASLGYHLLAVATV
jgi:SAM-dependent methyltransferase